MAKGKKTGGGSRKNVPNKATANAREAIARFIDGNAERLQGWLDQIAIEQGPKAAYECYRDLIEYHVPKLARTEHTGGTDASGNNKPIEHVVSFVGVKHD